MIRTKAETLEWLSSRLQAGRIMPLLHFNAEDWKERNNDILEQLRHSGMGHIPLIVRSSALGEDDTQESMAGRYLSVANVTGQDQITQAIDAVINSYGSFNPEHQVLVQPMLTDSVLSGVVFTKDPSGGGDYLVINYCEGADTTAVTGGRNNDQKTLYLWRHAQLEASSLTGKIGALAKDLEQLLDRDALDFEFAISRNDDKPILFQVRPLVMPARTQVPRMHHEDALNSIASKLASSLGPKPYLHGRRTAFGIMPDWNPAEIIGVRPRSLSLSLYRDLVTDSIWAYQRHNYGYKDLRSFPLMIDFFGLPYIDVRVSFNSFIPADINDDLSTRLVNHYVDRLLEQPALHDKVEFEIVLSCYTFDIQKKLRDLPKSIFTDGDRNTLSTSLRHLTNTVINRENGLWRQDAARIAELEQRHAHIRAASMDTVSRIYWLLEDVKRYGTLPFAGLARAGFIATQILESCVRTEVISRQERDSFIEGLETIGSRIGKDLLTLDRAGFLSKYGHLRPGTYDILSPRYDEEPDLYFSWNKTPKRDIKQDEPFSLSLKQMRSIERLLEEHGIDHTVVGLFDFLEASIRGREYAKFVFTRSLSDALSLLKTLGAEHGFTEDDMSFCDIRCIHTLHSGAERIQSVLKDSIASGRERYALTRQLILPPFLVEPEQVWGFQLPACEPNFITQKTAIGPVLAPDPAASLDGAIVFLPNADPGFDWIFSRSIIGFVTAYGGVNSHMAIRACELGLPAVIGTGEALYARWSQAHSVRLDCLNRQVQILQ